MENSTYVFINKKYRSLFKRKMEKETSSDSNLSTDSLEDDFKKKTSLKNGGSEDNVDTILVPFYEKDVLVKVPKDQKRNRETDRLGRSRLRESNTSSYLVNNDSRKTRRTTYLEMFRKQLSPKRKVGPKHDDNEIRSLSPEVGDTERDSIDGDNRSPTTQKEFYNTESYNEIYYDKLLRSQGFDNYIDSSFEEDLNKNSGDKSPHEIIIENLKSVSEVSQPNPRVRRATLHQAQTQTIQAVKLGGLGPDVERIKPRLERARSLQRYSEKVRMENRLRIYKKSVQLDNDKVEKDPPTKQRNSKHEMTVQKDVSVSYLVNKSSQPKTQKSPTNILNRLYSKTKSADVKLSRTKVEEPTHGKYLPREKSINRPTSKHAEIPISAKDKRKDEKKQPERAKSSTRNKGINTVGKADIPPVQINFMVNVDGIRPSSALRNMEEKHRLYKEQVKAFKMENNE